MATLADMLQFHGLKENDLVCVVSEEHRNEIAREIGAQWEVLATCIGLSDVEVGDLKEQQYGEPVSRRMAMMTKWHQKNGRNATYLRLINGLMEIPRNDLVEKLLEGLQAVPANLCEMFKYLIFMTIMVMLILFLYKYEDRKWIPKNQPSYESYENKMSIVPITLILLRVGHNHSMIAKRIATPAVY